MSRRKETCCGPAQLRVSDYIDRGLRRRREKESLPLQGPEVLSPNGLRICFLLKKEGRTLANLSYESSACVTLLAYAERLIERVRGMSSEAALQFTARSLIEDLPRIPLAKQDRAALAVTALHQAIRSNSPVRRKDPDE